MEDWQKDHILANLPALIELTECNAPLLAFLQSKQIFDVQDVEELSLATKTRTEKARDLFAKITKRANSYNLLKEAFLQVNQSGAHAILNQRNEHNSSTPFPNLGLITYDPAAKLGSGMYNTSVFQGKFEERKVAVKVMLINTLEDFEQAKKEATLLPTVDRHENIVRYFKTEITERSVLIALEKCDIDLHNFIMEGGAAKICLVGLLHQTTKGIGYLHRLKIIHRDLKPQNILILFGFSGEACVKITDFGISRIIPDGKSKLVTGVSSGIGTEGWTAPEIIKYFYGGGSDSGSELHWRRSVDIFSLGCIFYFVLTIGKHPFGIPFELRYKIHQGLYSVVEEEMHEMIVEKAEFKKLIKRMIRQDESKRPTAEAVLANTVFQYNFQPNPEVETVRKEIRPKFQSRSVEISEPGQGTSCICNDEQKGSEIVTKPRNSLLDTDKEGNTKLHIAIQNKDELGIRHLIKKVGVDVNAKNKQGWAPLHEASILEDKEIALRIIKMLIDNQADIYQKTDENRTFLHELLAPNTNLSPSRFHNICEFLVDRKLAGIFNEPGWKFRATPFHYAVRAIEVEEVTLQLLHKNQVNFNPVNSYGNTVFYFALEEGRSVELLKKLVAQGCNWKQRNNRNQTVLHLAARFGRGKALEYFLSLGMSANERDRWGDTPLHRLCESCRREKVVEIAKILVQNGGDPSLKNDNGQTPLDFAKKRTDLRHEISKLKAVLKS